MDQIVNYNLCDYQGRQGKELKFPKGLEPAYRAIRIIVTIATETKKDHG